MIRLILGQIIRLSYLLFCIFSFFSCSASDLSWLPPQSKVKVTLVGPIYLPNEPINFRFIAMVQKALTELKNDQANLLPRETDGMSVSIRQKDWLLNHEEFLKTWGKIQSEGKLGVAYYDNSKITAILNESAVHNDNYIILIHLVPPLQKEPRLLNLEGYRFVKFADDETEANMFRATVLIQGKNPIEEVKKVLLRLITSHDFSSPSLGDMGFALIKGGCYQMGNKSSSEECVKDFYLSKYPVTSEQWEIAMQTNPSRARLNNQYPVVNVNWEDTQIFLEELNDLLDRDYRLPTEAEWEYACRNLGKNEEFGTQTGEISRGLANYAGQGELDNWISTSPVGSFPPNGLGLFDMSGNVWEWTQDKWIEESFVKEYLSGFMGKPIKRLIKGGSFDSLSEDLRCAKRKFALSSSRTADIGLRLVLEK